MRGTHVVAFFKAPDSERDLFAQGDQVLEALLEAEAADPSVTDSTVSIDAEFGIVEAYAPGLPKAEGESRIVDRINDAVRSTVGLAREHRAERVVEYA
ncbi:MAG: hypothetical protein ACRDN9_07925 [Streptosporangiaceae bacterium]